MRFAALALPDAPAGALSGACAACGTDTTTGHPVPWSSNFVALDRLAVPRSRVVCAPCAALLGNSPRPGKTTRPLGWRMFSLLARDKQPLQSASKAEKAIIRGWLLAAPYPERWGCLVADSGKKQLAPWAPVNPPGASPWRVQFEELIVAWTAAGLAAHLAVVEALYQLGLSKAELLSHDWSVGRLRALDASAIRSVCAQRGWLAPRVHSPQHYLAVWLAQRPDPDPTTTEEEETHDDDA